MAIRKIKKSAKPKIKDLPASKKTLSAEKTDAIKGGFKKVPCPYPTPTLPGKDL